MANGGGLKGSLIVTHGWGCIVSPTKDGQLVLKYLKWWHQSFIGHVQRTTNFAQNCRLKLWIGRLLSMLLAPCSFSLQVFTLKCNQVLLASSTCRQWDAIGAPQTIAGELLLNCRASSSHVRHGRTVWQDGPAGPRRFMASRIGP